MHMIFRKVHPVLKIANNALSDLPAPANLSTWWSFGSLLGLCLVSQIITGLFLSMHYAAHVDLAFSSVVHIMRDVEYGSFMRAFHANGASWFFICIYVHIGRGIFYGSYIYQETWNIGIILLFSVMGASFLGYVLPWGQMSFWGATVITNLLSAVPYVGKFLVEWVWGGFAVGNATLTRFFSIHFLIPFLMVALSALHLLFLHETGSNNPLGVSSDKEKISFHGYYTYKDLVGFIILLSFLSLLCFYSPQLFTDPENFIPANPLITPVHIQPEWYFLFAYAILRSIPNKLGGVVALVMSIAILFLLPYLNISQFRGMSFYYFSQVWFWLFVGVFLILTWIGACPVEPPYEQIGQVFTGLYFLYYLLLPFSQKVWDITLNF